MLRIESLFVSISYIKIIRKPSAIQTRTLTLQSSPLVTQTSVHYYRSHMNPPEVENAWWPKYLRAASPKYQLDLETAKNQISSNSPRMKPYGH